MEETKTTEQNSNSERVASYVVGRGRLYRWFSICSVHREYKKGCNCCECGNWVFMPKYYLTHFLLSFPFSLITHWIWYWWVNRKKHKEKWLNQFINRETGEKENPFPNLKG